jgi:hypothetical protein
LWHSIKDDKYYHLREKEDKKCVVQFNIISFFLTSCILLLLPSSSCSSLSLPLYFILLQPLISQTFLLEDYTRFCFALADHDSAILCGGGGGTLSLCDQPSANDTGTEKQAFSDAANVTFRTAGVNNLPRLE